MKKSLKILFGAFILNLFLNKTGKKLVNYKNFYKIYMKLILFKEKKDFLNVFLEKSLKIIFGAFILNLFLNKTGKKLVNYKKFYKIYNKLILFKETVIFY